MPTKLTVAPSFHRQVIVVFVCVPASLPRACMLAAGRATRRLLLLNVLRWCSASQSARVCQRSRWESVGRLVVASICSSVCEWCVYLLISRYINCLSDLISTHSHLKLPHTTNTDTVSACLPATPTSHNACFLVIERLSTVHVVNIFIFIHHIGRINKLMNKISRQIHAHRYTNYLN